MKYVRIKHGLIKTCSANHIQKCSTFITQFLRMHYSIDAQRLKIGLEKLNKKSSKYNNFPGTNLHGDSKRYFDVTNVT